MVNAQFKFYVINWDFNKKKVINFNIFDNISLNDAVNKEIRKYVRCPKNYSHSRMYGETTYGFKGLCDEILSLIQWQEWARCEYEIMVGDLFEDDPKKYEKWDCYMQAKPNIEIITRECLYQYRKAIKESKNGNIKE